MLLERRHGELGVPPELRCKETVGLHQAVEGFLHILDESNRKGCMFLCKKSWEHNHRIMLSLFYSDNIDLQTKNKEYK